MHPSRFSPPPTCPPFSSHLFKQRGRLNERVTDQIVVRHNDGHPWVRLQVVRLRLHGELADIIHDFVHVFSQRFKGVLEVLVVYLLFGSLIICLAGHIKVVGGALIVLL